MFLTYILDANQPRRKVIFDFRQNEGLTIVSPDGILFMETDNFIGSGSGVGRLNKEVR